MKTMRSGRVGVDVGVGVLVGVGVGVLVGVGVGVLVGVGVGVLVGVGVGVLVGVGVGVLVGVGVGVGVLVGVGVSVGVGVGVFVSVGVGVGRRTLVVMVTELFVSSDSTITSSGSTVAVLETVISKVLAMTPVILMVASSLGARRPRVQSSLPPVLESRMMQKPWVVEAEVYVKEEGGSSKRRTGSALAEPMFCTWMM